MREIRTSGLMSGDGKRSVAPQGPSYRARPRLYGRLTRIPPSTTAFCAHPNDLSRASVAVISRRTTSGLDGLGSGPPDAGGRGALYGGVWLAGESGRAELTGPATDLAHNTGEPGTAHALLHTGSTSASRQVSAYITRSGCKPARAGAGANRSRGAPCAGSRRPRS